MTVRASITQTNRCAHNVTYTQLVCIDIGQIWHTDYQELSHFNALGIRYHAADDPCAIHNIHVLSMNIKAYCTIRNVMNPSKIKYQNIKYVFL